MSKTILTFAKATAAAVLALSLNACGFDAKSITGSGHVTTVNRNISGDFTAIDVDKGIDVTIEQADAKSIMVEADDNLQEHIHTSIAGGTLKITSDYGNYNNITSKKVVVKIPVIKDLNTSGGSKITSVNTLKCDDLTVKSASGSDVEITVEADDITCEASSGSHISVSGKAMKLNTEASSGSAIEAGNLVVNDVNSKSSSGSSTDVHPIVSLQANASSGSSIEYLGDPQKIEKKASSGGSVSAK